MDKQKLKEFAQLTDRYCGYTDAYCDIITHQKMGRSVEEIILFLKEKIALQDKKLEELDNQLTSSWN